MTLSPLVSVVIPVLGDSAAVGRLMAQVQPYRQVEVIVVDGGHDAALDSHADGSSLMRVVRSPAGRARQMNAGAEVAAGRWLLFLHADSRLPDGWLDAFARTDNAIGGWFRFALDDSAWQARVIESLVACRVRILRLPYGDQGFFVRRDIFGQLGGYRDMPFLEDVDFVRRLIAKGPTREIALPLRTSSRRWRTDGWWRRSIRNVAIVVLYFAGVPAGRLARWYRVRPAPRE